MVLTPYNPPPLLCAPLPMTRTHTHTQLVDATQRDIGKIAIPCSLIVARACVGDSTYARHPVFDERLSRRQFLGFRSSTGGHQHVTIGIIRTAARNNDATSATIRINRARIFGSASRVIDGSSAAPSPPPHTHTHRMPLCVYSGGRTNVFM